MNEHLTPEEFSQWFAGGRTAECDRHVAECESCRIGVEEVAATIAALRDSVHEWGRVAVGDGAPIAWQAPFRPFRPSRSMTKRWILAAASLLILASGTAYWRYREQARIADMAHADALLQQVDAEISRAVPDSMEPLVSLVTWGAGPTDERRKKELQ